MNYYTLGGGARTHKLTRIIFAGVWQGIRTCALVMQRYSKFKLFFCSAKLVKFGEYVLQMYRLFHCCSSTNSYPWTRVQRFSER
jgi:hypothetical protein